MCVVRERRRELRSWSVYTTLFFQTCVLSIAGRKIDALRKAIRAVVCDDDGDDVTRSREVVTQRIANYKVMSIR